MSTRRYTRQIKWIDDENYSSSPMHQASKGHSSALEHVVIKAMKVPRQKETIEQVAARVVAHEEIE